MTNVLENKLRFKTLSYPLSFSLDYLEREPEVKRWITDYAKRNNKTLQWENDEIIVHFNSRNEIHVFLRKGQKNFPYFEFL